MTRRYLIVNLKRTLIKLTAACALFFTGAAAVTQSQVNTVAAARVKDVNKQVVVNYVAGYSIKSWKNYKRGTVRGNATANSYKHGTTLNVTGQVTYKKQVWYRLSDHEWILKRYTLTTAQWAKKAKEAEEAAKKAAKKAAKEKKLSKSKSRKAAKVVALAESELGKPYVWGATGPYSFDCSGLTSYVYKHAIGKNISRTTYTQVYQGKRVAVSSATLKKGDLLFWGPSSAPYHVGIYVGGGKYVHAATPSQGVIKQSLSYYFWPSTAKRII